MRTTAYFASLAILLGILPAIANEPKHTDAQIDGLAGPVRSVSAREERAKLEWHQPDGISVTWPISCRECEYDSEGNRIKNGQMVDGTFKGELIKLVRDSNGTVIEKILQNADGENYRRDLFGPFGITEQHSYEKGLEISSIYWFYDGNGRESRTKSFDRDGVLVSSSFVVFDASGNHKEQWDYGPNNSFSLYFIEDNNPKTDTFTFTNFQENGGVAVAFTTVGTKVLSYRQEISEKQPFGSTFFIDPVGKTEDAYGCNPDGSCDHVVSYFTDETRRHIRRVEWHDPAGDLKLSADYEYELDQMGNWTKRMVWVWNAELGERKLYETDYQALSYWGK